MIINRIAFVTGYIALGFSCWISAMNVLIKHIVLLVFVSPFFLYSDDIIDGAMVIPVFLDHGEYKVLLSKENIEGGHIFNGKAEGFGGRFDAEQDVTALDVAAREFWEEAVLEKTFGWSLAQTKRYLHQNEHVLVATKINDWYKFFPKTDDLRPDAIYYYIVYIDKELVDQFIARLFDAIQEYASVPTEENFKFREKGDIAIVDWNDFVDAIRKPNLQEGSRVRALVHDMNVRKAELSYVDLRSVLVCAFHKHFVQHEDPLTGSAVFAYNYSDWAQ